MKTLLEILLEKYRKNNRTRFLCIFIQSMNLQEGYKKDLLEFIRQNFTGKEAIQICNKYNVKLQVLPKEFGLFVGDNLSKRQERKLRIEWLKLLIQNYES